MSSPSDLQRSEQSAHSSHLLIATDDGFPAIVRAATELQGAEQTTALLVLVGSDAAFPFKPRPSTILIPGMPDGVIACAPQLDEFGIASRLASTIGLPGCYDGPVTELAELWLKSHEPARRAKIEILVSATQETVRAVEDLSRRQGLPVRVIPSP